MIQRSLCHVLVLGLLAHAEPRQSAPSDAFIVPAATVTVKFPEGAASQHWSPFQTAGFSVVVPSTIRPINLILGIGAGSVSSRTGDCSKIQTIDINLGIKADLQLPAGRIGLSPVAGISSMMIGTTDGKIIVFSSHAFSGVENEFGFFAGILPWYRWHRIELSLPVKGECILSSPQRFTTVSVSFQIGYRIER